MDLSHNYMKVKVVNLKRGGMRKPRHLRKMERQIADEFAASDEEPDEEDIKEIHELKDHKHDHNVDCHKIKQRYKYDKTNGCPDHNGGPAHLLGKCTWHKRKCHKYHTYDMDNKRQIHELNKVRDDLDDEGYAAGCQVFKKKWSKKHVEKYKGRNLCPTTLGGPPHLVDICLWHDKRKECRETKDFDDVYNEAGDRIKKLERKQRGGNLFGGYNIDKCAILHPFDNNAKDKCKVSTCAKFYKEKMNLPKDQQVQGKEIYEWIQSQPYTMKVELEKHCSITNWKEEYNEQFF